jgi:acetylglutamate kinase
MQLRQDLETLRVAVPYIRTFKNRVFVVKLGGGLCKPGRALDNLVDQMAVLHQLGIKLIVVHGGGPQATELTRKLGREPEVFAGRRITDDATLEVVKMAFAGTINTDLIAAFRKSGAPAIGLSGVASDLILATRRPPQRITDPSNGETRTIDFGHVGDIQSVGTATLDHLLAGGLIPVISSLAADREGHVLNINADTIASHIAVAVGAAKYFLVTNVDGVLVDPKDPATLQPFLDLSQLQELMDQGVISGGMIPKLDACRRALIGGIPRVHIINGMVADTLLGEVFTNEGCGTLLVESHDKSPKTNGHLPVAG